MAIEDPNNTGIQTVADNQEQFDETPSWFNPDSLETGADLGVQNTQGLYGYGLPQYGEFTPTDLQEDFDPYAYDFESATDTSYMLEDPEVPSGLTEVYAPTERDPFRSDWNEASLREIVDYEGERLSPEQMSVAQEAELFLVSLEQEALGQGFTDVNSFLRSIELNDEMYFRALKNKINESSAILNQFGDQYRFERASDAAAQIGEPRTDAERFELARQTLINLVSLGVYTEAEAIAILSSDEEIYKLLGQEAPEVPSFGEAEQNFIYAPWDTDRQFGFQFDPNSGSFVPALDENQFIASNNDGEEFIVTHDPNDRYLITGIASLSEYPDFFTGETQSTTEEPSPGQEETPNLRYAPWDTDKQFGYTVSSGVPQLSLSANQEIMTDTRGRSVLYTFDDNGRPASAVDVTDLQSILLGNNPPSITNYNYSDGDQGGDGEVTQNPPTGGGLVSVIGGPLDPLEMPVFAGSNDYDFGSDLDNFPSSVLKLFTGDEPELNLQSLLSTNFNSDPILNENFAKVSKEQYDVADGPKTTAQRVVQDGLNSYRYETDYYVFEGSPEELSQINYEQQNLVNFSRDGDNFAGIDSSFQEEMFNELVQNYVGGRGSRRSRNLGGKYIPAWSSNIFTDNDFIESMIVSLDEYMDVTGVPFESILRSSHEDINSGFDPENPDTFDISHFMFGDEESGWDGYYDTFAQLVRDSGGSVGTEQDINQIIPLERLALLASFSLQPIDRLMNPIVNERMGGEVQNVTTSLTQEFLNRYGPYEPPQFVQDVNAINMKAGGGYIGGFDGGMDDTISTTIDGSDPAALSSGEFVIPADVVSHLGDGNNQNGAAKLYNFLDQVRVNKTGSVEQPAPINDGIMSNMIGDNYGF